MADLSKAVEMAQEMDSSAAIAAVAQQVDREMAEANAAHLRELDAELRQQAIAELTKEQTWP